jgi:hypothetical protein
LEAGGGGTPAEWDEWSLCRVQQAREVYERFVPHFFFGCEGDDRITSWAFDARNSLGARIIALTFHYDLIDMRDAAAEAYEGVQLGLMSQRDFPDFVFVNPIQLHCGMNPEFFKGTILEKEALRSGNME